MKIEFKIPCNPPKSTAQASLRIMKRKDGSQFVGKFAKSKGQQTQNQLMSLLNEHRPEKSLTGPLSLSVRWVYPWRKSESKRNMSLGHMPCDKRPDCDNLMKLLGDCMTRIGFWEDDSQIADLRFQKFWGDNPGIEIAIEEI